MLPPFVKYYFRLRGLTTALLAPEDAADACACKPNCVLAFGAITLYCAPVNDLFLKSKVVLEGPSSFDETLRLGLMPDVLRAAGGSTRDFVKYDDLSLTRFSRPLILLNVGLVSFTYPIACVAAFAI